MVIIGLIYAWHCDKKYHETIENGIKRSYIVTAQNCRYSKRTLSNVEINVDGKNYYIKLDSKTCEFFTLNSIISVYYLKKYDEYIYKVKEYNDRFYLVLIILFVSLLPWTYPYKYYINKNKKKESS